MVLDWERRGRAEVPAGAKTAHPGAIPVVQVVIELKSADTGELTRAGITFEHLFDLFYSADIQLDRIDPLADLESVVHVHYEPPSRPTLDDSIPEIRASSVRNPQFPFAGTNKYTGLGVIVGIIDSGINILHPAFRLPNDQTKTRILALLDQTASPPVTFTKAQIEASIAAGTQIIQPGSGTPRVETDSNDHKHGTHVAGIAAGNGSIAGNCGGQYKYVGVAPEATFVIVKYDFSSMPASLQKAIDFVATTAAAIPGGSTPAVINMSFGHSIGPHDGTDLTDRMIDNWLATRPAGSAPVVLVASAGNDGDGKHATGTISPGGVVKRIRFELNAEKSVKGQAKSTIDLRFTAPNGLGCRLIPPGNNTSGGSNLAVPDGATSFTETNQNSSCSVTTIAVAGAAAGSRSLTLSILSAANGKNQPGDWAIELTNAGAAAITYHAWIRGDQYDKLKDDVSSANTVGSPGSSSSIITVGNYYSDGKDKGKIAGTSSRGPRVDGMQKPDIAAPGQEICSAARDFHQGCCCDCCCDSYIDLSGTSMSAPHVTGAVALALERNLALTHQQIKTALLNAARKDTFTGPANGNDFGNGKLDVVALLNDPLVANGLPNVTSVAATALSAEPAVLQAARSASHLRLPQLEEGTPLWRLLQTEDGQRMYELGRLHWEEARALVNGNKRVATVWHRNFGPLLLHHVTRTVMLPHVALPLEIEGELVTVRAARIVSAIEVYASRDLRAALHTALPWVGRLAGKTIHEVVEMLETTELQNA